MYKAIKNILSGQISSKKIIINILVFFALGTYSNLSLATVDKKVTLTPEQNQEILQKTIEALKNANIGIEKKYSELKTETKQANVGKKSASIKHRQRRASVASQTHLSEIPALFGSASQMQPTISEENQNSAKGKFSEGKFSAVSENILRKSQKIQEASKINVANEINAAPMLPAQPQNQTPIVQQQTPILQQQHPQNQAPILQQQDNLVNIASASTQKPDLELKPSGPAPTNYKKAASSTKFHQIIESTSGKIVSERMNEIGFTFSDIALAAGDDPEQQLIKKGFWMRGIYGYSKQGVYTNASGEQELGAKGHSKGGSIGFDIDIGDSKMFGVALSRIHGDFKDQDSAAAGTNKSNVYTLYGKINYSKFIWDNTLSFSDSKISSKFMNDDQLYDSNFKNYGLVYNTKLYYKRNPKQITGIMPFIGVQYSYYRDTAQNATSKTGPAINILGRSDQSMKLLSGVSMKQFLYNKKHSNLKIIGSIDAHVSSNIMDKRDDIKIVNDGGYHLGSMKSDRQTKPSYSIGLSTMIKYKRLEIMTSYNYETYGTYHSHQGSLRLEIAL